MISEKTIAPEWAQTNATIRQVATELEAHLSKRLMEPGRVQLRIIAANFFLRWAKGHGTATGCPMGAQFFKVGTDWHRMGLRKSFALMIGELREGGLLVDHGAKFGEYVSRFLPSAALIEIFESYEAASVVFEAERDRRYIRLNGQEDNHRIDLAGMTLPAEVEAREALLRRYNSLLSVSLIDIPGVETDFIERSGEKTATGKPMKVYLKGETNVRSTFCRGSFDMGGRFYGGFWQSVGRHLRNQITINGESTVEVDFSSLHPRMLYGAAGVPVEGDLYELWEDADPYWRSAAKLMMLVAINSKDRKSALRAFQNEARKGIDNFGDAFHMMASASLADRELLLDALAEKHPAIADRFYSDEGVRLQRIDSTIAERVLRHFTDQGIVALCIHDSFIVAKRHSDELQRVMREEIEFEACIKSAPLSVKEGNGEEYPSKRYVQRLSEWQSKQPY